MSSAGRYPSYDYGNVFMLEIDSPILEIPDINSYNLYFGWYLGDLEQNEEFLTNIMRNIRIVSLAFLSMGQMLTHSISHPNRRRETIQKVIRQCTMSIC